MPAATLFSESERQALRSAALYLLAKFGTQDRVAELVGEVTQQAISKMAKGDVGGAVARRVAIFLHGHDVIDRADPFLLAERFERADQESLQELVRILNGKSAAKNRVAWRTDEIDEAVALAKAGAAPRSGWEWWLASRRASSAARAPKLTPTERAPHVAAAKETLRKITSAATRARKTR